MPSHRVHKMAWTPTLGKKRSQFFHDSFYGQDDDPAVARVRDEAMIVVEFQTNLSVRKAVQRGNPTGLFELWF
jgi:hypothetical protein